MCNLKEVICLCLLTFCAPRFGTILYAQTLTGTLQDSLAQPIPFANLLLGVNDPTAIDHFALVQNDGTYELEFKAQPGDTLYLNVRSVGYRILYDTLVYGGDDLIRHYTLYPSTIGLAEFTVADRAPPVIVRGDSTIYDAESFTSGREQNLRDILEKLPGVEVDGDDQVTVNGKPVDRITVENENFFGRGKKLALDRLPADVVVKVEVTDNHNDVGFLRGLTDEDELILNVKLKRDKQRFLFGRVRALAGTDRNYLAAGDLFYYAPELKLNVLADANTLNAPPLTFQDFMAMDNVGFGDFERMGESMRNFRPFMQSRRRTEHRSDFGAANWHHRLGSRWKMSGYALAADNREVQRTEATYDYFLPGNEFRETRRHLDRSDQLLGRAKLSAERPADDRSHTRFDLTGTRTDGTALSEILTTVLTTDSIGTDRDEPGHELRAQLHHDHHWENKQVGTLRANYQWSRRRPEVQYRADDPFLQPFVPFEPSAVYRLRQFDREQMQSLAWNYRHIVPLNARNHLHLRLDQQFRAGYYTANTTQPIADEQRSLATEGFGTDQQNHFGQHRVGVTYRLKRKRLTGQVDLDGSWLHRRHRPEDSPSRSESEFFLLPGLNIEYTWLNVAKLEASYQRDANYPDGNFYLLGRRVGSFNQLSQGSTDLRVAVNQVVNFSATRSDLLKGRTWNFYARLSEQSRGVQLVYEGTGITRLSLPVLTEGPTQNLSLRQSLMWRRHGWLYRPQLRFERNRYRQQLNGTPSERIGYRTSLGGYLRGDLGEHGELKLQPDIVWNRVRQADGRADFISYELELGTEWTLWKVIELKTNIDFYAQQRRGEALRLFPDWNATIAYRPDERPWHVELRGVNLLGTQFIRSGSLSEVAITERREFLFPRTVVAGVGYRF